MPLSAPCSPIPNRCPTPIVTLALIATMVAIISLQLGCQPKRPSCARVAPLRNLAEVYIYADTFSQEARRLDIEFSAIKVVGADGSAYSLSASPIKGAAMTRPRLLAWGRVPPGDYRAVSLQTKRALVTGGGKPSDLLVSAEVHEREMAFSVRSRQAAVLYFKAELGKLVQGVTFKPLFQPSVEPQGTIDAYGYVSNTGSQTLTVFDVYTQRILGVIPTGRDPKGFAINPITNRLYLALSAEDEVEVIDIAASESVKRIRLQPGDGPEEIVVGPENNSLIVVNRRSNTASFVDLGSEQEVARVPTGEEPSGVLLDRKGQRAYISNRRSNTITVLDTTNRAVVATVPTEVEPLRAQTNRDGSRLFVAHAASAYLMVYSLPDLSVVERIFVGLGMSSIKVDPNTDLLYVGMDSGGWVRIYDATSLVPVESFEVNVPVDEMTLGSDSNTMLLLARDKQTVSFKDLTNPKTIGEITVGCFPHSVGLMKERR